MLPSARSTTKTARHELPETEAVHTKRINVDSTDASWPEAGSFIMVGYGASLQIGNNNYCSSSAQASSVQRASAATAAATNPASATASAEVYAGLTTAIQPAPSCAEEARGVYDDTIVTDIRNALEHASCGIKLQGGAFHTVFYDPEVCAPNPQRSSQKLKVIEAIVGADGSKSPLVAIVSEGTCTVARPDRDDVGAASQTLGPSVAHTWLVLSCCHKPVTVTALSVIRD